MHMTSQLCEPTVRLKVLYITIYMEIIHQLQVHTLSCIKYLSKQLNMQKNHKDPKFTNRPLINNERRLKMKSLKRVEIMANQEFCVRMIE